MNTTEDLKEVLKKNVIDVKDISKVKEYIEASKKYESLIASGLTTKRGNNLLSRDKVNISQVRFNVL
tara:strand:+ start:18692 stop:18892 length:201 start_codon:yes stop_codon:yes gene_type:complete